VEPVKAQLVLDKEHDHNAAGHADGEPEDVDKRIDLVPSQVSKSDYYIIFKHIIS
jgi:hypothetical protein